MKKKLFMAASAVLMLMSLVLVSAYAQKSQEIGQDWHQEDVFKMVPAAEHEKRFPKGHVKKEGDKLCFHADGTSSYFCQVGYDWHAGDSFTIVPTEEHEKRFPKGHLEKHGPDADKQCFGEKGSPGYFCQFWDE